MPPSYHLVEPFPSALASATTHTARGGAGNVTKPTPRTAFTLPGSSTPRPNFNMGWKKRNNSFPTGRGGAGNMHHHSEMAIFSFDEELERQLAEQKHVAPVYHVGRGGAGNMVYLDGSVRRKSSTCASSDKSTSSEESGADTAARNIKKGMEKGWSKLIGVGNYVIG